MEFTSNMFEAILKNGRACIEYLTTSAEADSKGHIKKWLDNDRFHLTCVLADILYIYTRFQKCFEDYSATLFDIADKKAIVISSFRSYKIPH